MSESAFVVFNNSDSSIVAYYRFGYEQPIDRVAPDPQAQTALAIDTNHPAFSNQAQWKIQDGQLIRKNIVTLSASSPTFPADGTSSVDLTFTGLTASGSVEVGGNAVTVSPSDNVITLTCDAPRAFDVQLVDSEQWSNNVHVEAT